ncbi:MAG: kelch repeat-containing protein [candidate division KSB1 bacterium]|mgnify:CR=1 FL=1
MTMKQQTQLFLAWLWLTATLAHAQIASWEKLSPMPAPRYGHAAVVWDNKIVVIGGRDARDSTLARVVSFDLVSLTWSSFPANLQTPRCNAPARVYHNQIYVIGGNRANQVLDTVERFNAQSGKWEVLEPRLRIGRDGAAATVLKDTLFVIGGYDKANAYLKTVEYFNPATNTWSAASWQLSLPRAALSALSWRDTLYTFGGLFFGPVARLERYHAANGEQRRADMKKARGNMAAAIFKNKLWALGGSVQEGLTEAVESYDPSKNIWLEEMPLTFPRELHAAVMNDNKLYIVGGLNAEKKALADFESLSPPTEVGEQHYFSPPAAFEVLSYPNPFVEEAQLRIVRLKGKSQEIVAEVFALDGTRVRTLTLTPTREHLQASWNGRDESGREVVHGTYFIVVRSGAEQVTKKILKLGVEGGRR